MNNLYKISTCHTPSIVYVSARSIAEAVDKYKHEQSGIQDKERFIENIEVLVNNSVGKFIE